MSLPPSGDDIIYEQPLKLASIDMHINQLHYQPHHHEHHRYPPGLGGQQSERQRGCEVKRVMKR